MTTLQDAIPGACSRQLKQHSRERSFALTIQRLQALGAAKHEAREVLCWQAFTGGLDPVGVVSCVFLRRLGRLETGHGSG